MDIKDGDMVRIVCNDRTINDSTATKIFTGRVVSVFNAFDSEGDNWFIEVKSGNGGWFLYKPRIDGGTIEVVK